MAITFANLQRHYPKGTRAELFRSLKGQWPDLIDDPNYANTCSIRMSVALKKCDVTIPPGLREGMEGDGSPLVIKVATMEKLALALFGDQSWGMSKPAGAPFKASDFPPGMKGIVAYHVKWANATGHFDLWTASAFVGAGNFNDIKDGFQIGLWSLT